MVSGNDTIEALAGSEGKGIRQLGTSCVEAWDNLGQRLEQFGNTTAPGLEQQSTDETGCLTLKKLTFLCFTGWAEERNDCATTFLLPLLINSSAVKAVS